MTDNNTAEAPSYDEMFDEVELPDGGEEVANDEPETAQEIIEALEAPEYFEKSHKEYFTKLQELEGGREYAQAWHDQYNTGQKFINDKLAEFNNSKQDLDIYNQYQQALAPLQPQWAANGMNPAMGVAQLAHYGQMLQNDPQTLIKEIAQSRNIDLNEFLGEQPYVDPEMQKIQQTNQQLEQKLNGFLQQQQQAQQLQTQQTANTTITEFANAKNDKGEPANPYLEKVQDTMAQLLLVQNNGINDIKAAYEMAVQYNPEIQAEIQASTKQVEAVTRQNEAQKAKAASSKTQSKTKDAPKPKISWEDALEQDVNENWGT
jgi:hypothetical protein